MPAPSQDCIEKLRGLENVLRVLEKTLRDSPIENGRVLARNEALRLCLQIDEVLRSKSDDHKPPVDDCAEILKGLEPYLSTVRISIARRRGSAHVFRAISEMQANVGSNISLRNSNIIRPKLKHKRRRRNLTK